MLWGSGVSSMSHLKKRRRLKSLFNYGGVTPLSLLRIIYSRELEVSSDQVFAKGVVGV